MTNRKYQVFISASASELEAERKAAMKAVIEQGHLPVMLERFSAAIPSDFEVIQRVMRDSDVYLLLLGHRYGEVTSETNLSYTEIEYDLARKYGLTTLVFMLADAIVLESTSGLDPHRDNREFADRQRLTHFRDKVKHHHLVRYFTPGPEFRYLVWEALATLTSHSDRPGYVREGQEDGALLRVIPEPRTEALSTLLRGVDVWNAWRASRPEFLPDLSKADLREAVLSRADLQRADLHGANLTAADLKHADLTSANLSDAVLSHADLTHANLRDSVASGAQFLKTRLRSANFKGAMLLGANFCGADLTQVDFRQATVGSTVFADNDLSTATGLDSVLHLEPSSIAVDTIVRSASRLPEQFLRGAGLSEQVITYARSFSGKPIEYYSCFISYSSKDHDLAERLYSDLQQAGVRCWFAPQSLQIGDRFRERIDDSIRLHDRVLLILSEGSVNSTWVETEIRKALQEEQRRLAPVLIPIRVDDAVMETDREWAAELRRTRQIGDFRQWRDHDIYRKAASQLIRDLATDRAVEITRRQVR
jgi:uncharacterized protein YjbI with pentapeptide repeats